MADYTETTRTGWLGRIGKSVGGVIFGLLLFFGSFVLLYWNEGRMDLSQIAKTAIDVGANQNAPRDAEGNLVSVSGTVTTPAPIGDGLFFKPGRYVSINRYAEVYAWQEEKETRTRKDAVGGGETTVTTNRYKTAWVSRAADPSDFNANGVRQFERDNGVRIDNGPAQNRLVRSSETVVSRVILGRYTADTSGLILPAPSGVESLGGFVNLNVLGGKAKTAVSGEYIMIRKGASAGSTPRVGDERVSYAVLKSGFPGTAFGKLSGQELVSFEVVGQGVASLKNRDRLYRVFVGTKAEAVDQLHGEYVFWLWACRIIGFLMMWIGLNLILGPISTVLDIVGVIGSASRFLVGVATFFVSLALSLVTIIVGAVAHNIVVLVIALAVTVGGIVVLVLTRKKKAVGTKPPR